MFAAHDIMLDVGFGAAQVRLAILVQGGGLSGASQAAYEAGLASVIRVGPFGEVQGVSKLVRVRFLDPVYHAETMTVALRWEATGITGGLFPVLDADISLTPAGARMTRLAMVGAYRPPLGRLGAGLDRAILNRVATATIRSLLRTVADALASPETAAEKPDRNGQQSSTATGHRARDTVITARPAAAAASDEAAMCSLIWPQREWANPPRQDRGQRPEAVARTEVLPAITSP
jgi:hypothetical protein